MHKPFSISRLSGTPAEAGVRVDLVLSFWGIDGKRFFCKATPA